MAGGIGGKLTDKAVKAFVARATAGSKLADGGGLFLFITPAGTPTWRIKYRIGGKEKLYSVGVYPVVSLAAARAEQLEVKAQLLEGHDPVSQRRVERARHAADAEDSFQAVAGRWFEKKRQEWGDLHYGKSLRAFERDVYPSIGKLPIASITPAVVAKVLQTIHRRDVLETAKRIHQHVNGVFRFAQAQGLCGSNPAQSAGEILPRKRASTRMPALLTFAALGELLRRAEAARLSPSVRMAHRLCAFTAARIGNVVTAEWREFHLDDEVPVWVIPRARMKVADRADDHRIPLGPGIAEELRGWRRVFGSRGPVFPSPTGNRSIGRESLEKVYRVTLGLRDRHSPHGWRSAFATLAREHGVEREVVELALDHVHDNEVARAYDRGERFAQRVALYRWWDEQLVAAQQGTRITPFRALTAA